ncbi:zinc ribbon domain-containing protein [Candidatus Saccharibacteria bacterium]|nr:zinc ribbon domain-containing protein [Candidatus Saccharibacteria bacterium]
MARQMCQSCGMPLNDKTRGTEADGSPSLKYCNLCYQNGKFTQPNATAADMQRIGYEALRQKHWPGFLAKMAVNGVPKLERWNTPTK